jgi:hypothetical protein
VCQVGYLQRLYLGALHGQQNIKFPSSVHKLLQLFKISQHILKILVFCTDISKFCFNLNYLLLHERKTLGVQAYSIN